jgi:hypothetical protein
MKKENLRQVVFLAHLIRGIDINAFGVVEWYIQLLKLSKKLSKLDIDSCNGDITEDIYNDSVCKITIKINKICDTLSLFWYHQTDPRGVSLYISKVLLTSDNYNTTGVAIY